MKRVMVIVPTLGTGGGEKIAVDIAANIDKHFIDIIIVSLYPKKDTIVSRYAESAGLKVVYLNKRLGTDIHIISQLRKAINTFKPDVIHTHLYVVPYVMLAAPNRILKYHTVHNVAEKEAKGALRMCMRFAYRFGNFVPIAISPYCAKTFEKLYHISSDMFPTIFNGVDINKFKPNHSKHQGFRFINVGRFYTQKNQKLLLQAFSRVHDNFKDTVLEIVGAGPLRLELKNLVEQLDICDAVIMDGETDMIADKLNSSDVYVLSSDFEGLPVSVLEAMACGLPIVSTSAGGVIDIVTNNKNGLLVPVGDADALARAMMYLIENSKERERMGVMSRKMAENYSISKCAIKYQELYLREIKRS